VENKKKELAICYFGLLAIIAFFTPLYSIYDTSSLYFVIIVLTQWLLSRLLWNQQFGKKKTLLLWILMSILLVVTVFLRDRVVFYFGKEMWYHPISYYIYVGVASTFWWAMVSMLVSKQKKELS
jgi:hypothetical protein